MARPTFTDARGAVKATDAHARPQSGVAETNHRQGGAARLKMAGDGKTWRRIAPRGSNHEWTPRDTNFAASEPGAAADDGVVLKAEGIAESLRMRATTDGRL